MGQGIMAANHRVGRARGAAAASRIVASAIFFVLLILSGVSAAPAQTVRIATNLGNIDVVLQPASAPKTVANFLNYVNRGAYNGSFIHRSVLNFVIQGGGFKYDGTNTNTITADPPVQNEFKLSNVRGTLAMAKLSGDPNSATSQWFFNLANNSTALDSQNGGYTVFGVIADNTSLAVMDRIAAVQIYDLGSPFTELPLINYVSGAVTTANLVTVQSITVVPAGTPDYGITASPDTVNITAGQTGSTTLTVTPVNGFQGTVSFACGNVPSSVTYSFAPASVTFAAGSTAAQSTTLTINTKLTSSVGANTASIGGSPRGPNPAVPGMVLLAASMIGFTFAGSRSRLGMGLAAVAALALLSGCGGDSNSAGAPVVTTPPPTTSTTPPGTYTVPITVTSGSTSHPVNLTVVVK